MISKGKLKELEPVFYPRSIAVVGVSRDDRKTGHTYLKNLLDAGFKGKLYAVNPSGERVLGVETYTNLRLIPGQIDYAIINIPKRFILDLLDECYDKGVKVIQIYSAGFSETNTSENRELEGELLQKAKSLGIRIIGPNCIGAYCPSHGLSSMFKMPPRGAAEGSVGFVSQSGGYAGFFIEMGMARGLMLSKAVSFGNGNDLNAIDYLEYLGVDPHTSTIGAYLEGIKDGQLFLKTIAQIAREKPVVVLKGGKTEVGARTAASHTASLAGSGAVWKAALKQAGVVTVESLEELSDTVLTLECLPPFQGNQTAIVSGLFGAGGGVGVTASDAFVGQRFEIPLLTRETAIQLKALLPDAGSILPNPVDVGSIAASGVGSLAEPIEVIADDSGVDMLITHIPMSVVNVYLDENGTQALFDIFIRLREIQHKPILLVVQPEPGDSSNVKWEQLCYTAGIPTYPTFERAARAIANVTNYWKFRRAIM